MFIVDLLLLIFISQIRYYTYRFLYAPKTQKMTEIKHSGQDRLHVTGLSVFFSSRATTAGCLSALFTKLYLQHPLCTLESTQWDHG